MGLLQALPGGAGKNQASHSICSHPACSFTLVALTAQERCIPCSNHTQRLMGPADTLPPSPPALRFDDLLFLGCWEITGGEGLTGAHGAARTTRQKPQWPPLVREIWSASACCCCCCLVSRLLVPTGCGAAKCPPATPSKCPVNGVLSVFPLAFNPFLHLLRASF